MYKSVYCKNFNHGRMLVSIQYCSDCGEKFKVQADSKNCTEFIHDDKRKNQKSFCCDCGIRLSPIRKN